ncbi:VP5 [Gokushovirus WZ-2015a]|nr:VP5 [Gokushovirus WZ-2015a]
MILNIYAIRDTKSGYMNPTFELNDAVAMRNFQYACQQTDSMLFACASDFELYQIGWYNTETGSIEDGIPHRFLCSGTDAVMAELNKKE